MLLEAARKPTQILHKLAVNIMRILLLFWMIPVFVNCQSVPDIGLFVRGFSKCVKLKVDDNLFHEDAMIYFEIVASEEDIRLTHLIGEHKEQVYKILLNAFDCMAKEDIGDGAYQAIMIIENLNSEYQDVAERNNARASTIDNFKNQYNLSEEAETIIVSYSKSVH